MIQSELQYSEQQWAHQTFIDCRLPDHRLHRRLICVGAALARRPEASLSAACGTDDAARLGGYRLIENNRVEAEAIAEGGFAATVQAAKNVKRILAPSDTTTLSFAHSAADELGDVGGPEQRKARGWLVHSSMLIDAQRATAIGLIDQQWRVRSPEGRGRKHARKNRPYEAKESFKWQATSEHIESRLGDLMERVIEVCDAEADVYEFLAFKTNQGHRFIVRIAQNRRLSDADERLWKHLSEQPALGEMTVKIGQKGGRPAREATVKVRSAVVTLQPPSRSAVAGRAGEALEPMTLQAVLGEEEHPPQGAEPLRWRLYTSEAAETSEEAVQVMNDYAQRWQIEEYHKAWKSGCKVEQQRQQTAANLQRMSQIRAFVAMRLLQLKQHAALEPEESCEPLVDSATWRCLWVSVEKNPPPPPDKPPTHGWLLRAVARLGGWYDSKRTGRPGWEALRRGWQELQSRLTGYKLALAGPL